MTALEACVDFGSRSLCRLWFKDCAISFPPTSSNCSLYPRFAICSLCNRLIALESVGSVLFKLQSTHSEFEGLRPTIFSAAILLNGENNLYPSRCYGGKNFTLVKFLVSGVEITIAD